MARMKRHILEIYKPGSAYDVLITLECEDPFMSIARGELLNTRLWNLGGQANFWVN